MTEIEMKIEQMRNEAKLLTMQATQLNRKNPVQAGRKRAEAKQLLNTAREMEAKKNGRA